MQSYEDAVLKVVMWWSDKSFRAVMNQNNGDNSQQGGIVSALMNMASLKAQDAVSDEQIKKFESKLTDLLMNAGKFDRTLSVDYDPCEMLYRAAEFSGIDTYCFPCKSYTRIDDQNNAYAKYQYGAQEVKL